MLKPSDAPMQDMKDQTKKLLTVGQQSQTPPHLSKPDLVKSDYHQFFNICKWEGTQTQLKSVSFVGWKTEICRF